MMRMGSAGAEAGRIYIISLESIFLALKRAPVRPECVTSHETSDINTQFAIL